MLNPSIIEINDEQAQKAKVHSGNLAEINSRKRAMIDLLGINCAISYLNDEQIRIETKRSIHKIPKLYEEFKITDIYYNNYRIDVITIYREKIVKIPKIHFENDIIPNFYFIVQVGARLKEAKIIGFMEADKVRKSPGDSKYYYPPLNLIFDTEKFKSLTRRPVAQRPLLGKHSDCLGLFLKFIDNDLSNIFKKQLIQHLMSCDTCRANFVDTMEFDRIAQNVVSYPDLIDKYAIKEENTATNPIAQSKFEALELENEKINQKMRLRMIEEEKKRRESEKLKEAERKKIEETKLKIQQQKAQAEKEALLLLQKQKEEQKKAKAALLKQQKEEREKLKIQKQQEEVLEKFKDEIAQNEEEIEENSKVIEEIFDELPKIELPSLSSLINSTNRRRIVTIGVVLFLFVLLAMISVKGSTKFVQKNDENALAQFNSIDQEEYFDSEYYPQESRQAQLITRKNSVDDFTIKSPVSTKPAYSPTITNVSWEVGENLVKKANYTKFLQLAGKNIKLNLQNDLLLVNDLPSNKQVKVDIKISSSGEILSTKLARTSGSEQIDASIKKVVQDTLSYMKPPSLGVMAKASVLTLLVELY